MTAAGARITDAVGHLRGRGNLKGAVRLVRVRQPERLRWRSAVAGLTAEAGQLLGRNRMRVEEPLREIVLDLSDPFLRREVVLDARLNRVDLDRGEVLPCWTLGDLRRMTYLARTELSHIQRYVPLPKEFDAPIDTAAVVLVGRSFARMHRQRAHRLWLQIPDSDGPTPRRLHHQYMAERAELDADLSKRWLALSKALGG